MTVRVGLLQGRAKNKDMDTSAIIRSIIGANGIIVGGLELDDGVLSKGSAFVQCTRTGEFLPIVVHFTLESDHTVGALADGDKVYLTVNQDRIDDGATQDVDGRNIGSVGVGAVVPANSLVLYEKVDGDIIPATTQHQTTEELATTIESLTNALESTDQALQNLIDSIYTE